MRAPAGQKETDGKLWGIRPRQPRDRDRGLSSEEGAVATGNLEQGVG